MEITREVAAKVLATVDTGLSHGLGNPVPGEMCVEAAVCYALGLPHGDDPKCVSPALHQLKINLNDKQWSSNAVRAKGLRRLALAQLGSTGHLDNHEFMRRIADLAIRKSVPIALRAAASIQKDATHKDALLTAALRCEKEGTLAAASAAAAAGDAAAYAAAYAAASAAADAADAAAYASAAASAAAAGDAAGDADAAASAASAASAAAYAYASAAAAAAAADAYAAAADAADAGDAAAAYAAAAAADAAAAYAYASAAAGDKVLSEFAEDVVHILIEMKAPGCQWLDLAEPVAA